METIKKQLPLFLTIVAGICVASLLNEQIAKARVKALG
jgi:hypothetical protein